MKFIYQQKLEVVLCIVINFSLITTNAYADKSGVEPSRVKLPKGPGSLEGLGEDAKVEGNMGVMGYSVPFALPQSYNTSSGGGWGPSLSLQYSSSGGMEEVGMGWSLSMGGAPSRICRMTSRGLPRYTAEDGFIAGSDELVQVGEAASDGQIHRVYRKRFVQAEPEGGGLSGAGTRYVWISDAGVPEEDGAHGYWKVEHPDSTVSYYGSNPLGRIFEESRVETSRGTFCYGLTERQDAWGHWIRYGYEKDRDEFDERRSGRPYLVRISWHQNREDSLDEGVGTRYSAALVYEERPDILTDGKPGALVRTDERLSEVLVYVRGEVLRRYDLIYHDEWAELAEGGGINGQRGGILDVERSLLYEVKTYGLGGEDIFPTIHRFSYTEGFAQQNQDQSNQGTVHALTAGQGLEESDDRLGAAVDFQTGLADLVDINGDSLPDIVYTPRDGAHQFFIQEAIERGDGESWMYQFASARVSETSGRGSALLSSGAVHMADLDGNGKSDLFDQANGRILWNDGEGDWAAPENVDSEFLPDLGRDADMKLLDVDYDRNIDVFHLGPGAAWYRKNPGNGQLEAFEWVDGSLGVDIPNVGFSDDSLELSDMNGDGMVDLVTPLRAGQVVYYANLGWGRFSQGIEMPGLADNQNGDALDLKYIDLNGDGLSDAVSVQAESIRYALNQNGERFLQMQEITETQDGGDLPHWDPNTTTIRYADMNGSGSTDIVYITSSGLIEYLELFETAPNLLKQIENGIGKVITAEYQNTTEMRLENQALRAAAEQEPHALPHPMTVVKSISVWDVHSRITDTTHYNYQGAYYDHQEHQFRGFRNVNIRQEGSADNVNAENSSAAESIEEAFTQEQYDVGEEDRVRKGLLLLSSLQSAGEPLSTSQNTYEDCVLASILGEGEQEVVPQDISAPRAEFICQVGTETVLQERKDASAWVRTEQRYLFDGYGREVQISRLGVTSIGGGACSPCEEQRDDAETRDPLHHRGEACGPSCLGDEDATRTLWITPGPERNKTGGHWNLSLPYQKEQLSLPEHVLRDSGQNAQPMKLTEKYYYDGEAHVGLPHPFAFRGALSRKTVEGEGSFRGHSISATVNGSAIATERFGYDNHGQVISSLDANGNERTFSYNEHLLEGETLHLTDYSLRMRIGEYHPLFDTPTSITRWQVIEGGEATSRAHTSHYGYDVFGRIVSIQHPDDLNAPSQVFEYDIQISLSRLISRTSTGGDGNYNLEKVQCFDARGRAVCEKTKLSGGDAAEVGLSYQVSNFTQYGKQGRAIRGYQPYLSERSECDESAPAQVRYTSTSYDGTGRVLEITHPDASVFGNASTEKKVYGPLYEETWDRNDTDPAHPSYGTPTIVTQDGLGRTVRQTRLTSSGNDTSSIETTFFYDGLGRLTALTGPEGHTQWQVTDALGRVTLTQDPNRGESRMGYDAAGNLLEGTDSRGEATAYRYDAANRLIAQWHQNEGDRAEQLPAHGQSRDLITWTYDRPLEDSRCGDGADEEAGCGNEAGALSSVTYDLMEDSLEVGREFYLYDARGRAAFTAYERRGKRFSIHTQYDHADRILQQDYPADISVSYAYDGGGRLVSIAGLVESQQYFPEGMVASRALTNGTFERYAYDDILALRGHQIGGSDNSTLHHLAYTRDRKGQITEVEDLRPEISRDSTLRSDTAQYHYDALDRLIQADLDAEREKAEELTYRYSPSGKILEKASSLRERSAAHLGNYRYNPNIHPHAPEVAGVWSLRYDNSGNLTEQSLTQGNYSLSHNYNHLGQLRESTRASGRHPITRYSYSADGERAVKWENGKRVDYLSPNLEIRDGIITVHVKDLGESSMGGMLAKLESSALAAYILPDVAPLEQTEQGLTSVPDNEITSADAWVVEAQAQNILIIEEDEREGTQKVSTEELLAASVQRLLLKHDSEEDSVTKTFYHSNHLGSTAITTDEEGELLTRVHYYPYGTIRQTAAELPTYNFTGKERDTTTGLSYHSARYLSPTFANWTQPDPLFHTLSDKTIELPWQASNPYGYGLQNPIQYTDPEGTVAFLALVAVKLVSTAVAFAGVKIAESIAASQMDAERSKKLNHDVNSALAETAKVQATEVLAAGVGEAAGLAMSAGARYLSKGAGRVGSKSPYIDPRNVAGKTPNQIDKFSKSKGLIPKGNPKIGKGSYVDPVTGKQRVLTHPKPDSGCSGPHCHVNNPSGERLDINGNVVPRNSTEAHLPLGNQ